MISRATHTSSPKDISCRRPLRRKGSIEQRFWSKKLVDGTQPQVLWTDEKLFTVQAVHNHQNDRIWLPDINMVPVERRSSFRRQKPPSVMVWAGATSKGLKTPLIFIEGVKINQTVYRRMLEEKVLPWVQEVVGEQGVTLQQDGATSHTANSVQAWCRCNFKGFWEKELILLIMVY